MSKEQNTEPPFSGAYWNTKEKGKYLCRECGTELFSSDTKYDSGSGWPSFWAPLKDDGLTKQKDDSLGVERIEVSCAKCGAHLGHVFDDGPNPTGKRYCINSFALALTRVAYFGGGCFWCMEAVFTMLRGVKSVAPGYMEGAEVVQVIYDPSLVSYDVLLTVFFGAHDPTTLNRQGNDIGPQYRSVIFYADDEEKKLAEQKIEAIQNETDGLKIVTELALQSEFKPAGEEHKKYYERNPDAPYCQLVINPKLKKVKEQFAELLKKEGEK